MPGAEGHRQERMQARGLGHSRWCVLNSGQGHLGSVLALD